MAKTQISNVDFVKAYIASESSEELAANTGLTIESARSRAAKLRKAGVALPKFDRKREIDITGLNAIINAALVL
jgi:hypothetical protein